LGLLLQRQNLFSTGTAGSSLNFGNLLNLGGEIVDLAADVSTERLEREHGCQGDERCGHRIFGKFKTSFVFQEIPKHLISFFDLKALALLEGRCLTFPPATTNTCRCRFYGNPKLFDLGSEVVDLAADVSTQRLERKHGCQGDERCGHGVL
jgi:hypothetical protein